MKLLPFTLLTILVSSCNSGRPSFTNMDAVELAAYNRGLPAEKQIFCVEEATSSSYIRRRVCQSFEEWMVQNEQNAMKLDVLNSRPGFSLPNSIQDGPRG